MIIDRNSAKYVGVMNSHALDVPLGLLPEAIAKREKDSKFTLRSEAFFIAVGVVTHTPQRVLLQTEPQPTDYADASAYTLAHDAWEEDCDADGEVWTYRMLPLAAPGAGQERRSDTIGAL